MLDVENLSVVYSDKTVGLRSVTLHLENGEKCALIGANGAGKTTLLMALVGVLPSRGRAALADVTLSPENLPELRRKVGVVLQNPDDQLFLPTIGQDVAFGLENLGMARTQVRERTDDILKRLGLEHLKERSALRLSGGEKRMAALASVLVMEPELLLLDEPTAFLDPRARRRLLTVLRDLPQTLLVATHDLGFALELCPRTVLLREGAVFAEGETQKLLFDDEQMEQGGVESLPVYNGLRQKGAAIWT